VRNLDAATPTIARSILHRLNQYQADQGTGSGGEPARGTVNDENAMRMTPRGRTGGGSRRGTKTVRWGKVPIKLRSEPQYSIIKPDNYGTAWNFRFQIAPVIPNPF
jgi:hypothetical protein